ncbi:hypothetical protein RFF05_01040 [Bengtsoniella intestinalis]|uniref:hypothetical protein n=1 Tax=Bengtsoniella intestinalis TaxID=3073143 RepID=UPI00391F59E6
MRIKGFLLVMFVLWLCGCEAPVEAVDPLAVYTQMTGATMEAEIISDGDFLVSEFILRCDYNPNGETVVEVLAPETMAGVQGVLHNGQWVLQYQDMVFNVGALSTQAVSPLACLPLLLEGLRQGWTLEENTETYQDQDCYRVTLDYSDDVLQDVVVTAWLSVDNGTPVGGEIAVEGERILQVVFTSFQFYDILG